MLRLRFSNKHCSICGRGEIVGTNRPHSLHKTKKVVKPNLQKFQGKEYVCVACMRTLTKSKATSHK